MKWIKSQDLFIKENFETYADANEDVKYFNSIFSNLGMELIIKEFSNIDVPFDKKNYMFEVNIDLYKSIFRTYFDKLNFIGIKCVLPDANFGSSDNCIISLNNNDNEKTGLVHDHIKYNLDRKLFTDDNYFLNIIYSSLVLFFNSYKYELYVIGKKLNDTDDDMDNTGYVDGSVILKSIIDYINLISNKRVNFDINVFGDIVSKNINEVSRYSLFKDCPFYDSLIKNLSDNDIKGIDDMTGMGF